MRVFHIRTAFVGHKLVDPKRQECSRTRRLSVEEIRVFPACTCDSVLFLVCCWSEASAFFALRPSRSGASRAVGAVCAHAALLFFCPQLSAVSQSVWLTILVRRT